MERRRAVSAWFPGGSDSGSHRTTTLDGTVDTRFTFCVHCECPVTAEYLPDDGLVRPENVFPCPSCWTETTWSVPGRLTDLWRGHRPTPKDPS